MFNCINQFLFRHGHMKKQLRSFYDKGSEASLGSVYLLISSEDKRYTRTLAQFLHCAPGSIKPEFKELWKENERDRAVAQKEEQFCPDLKSTGKCWVRKSFF